MVFIPTLALELRAKVEAGIPEGRVVPEHTENEHWYKDTVDGEVYGSVTTKTSLLSRSYYKQMAADKAVDHLQAYLLNNLFSPEGFAIACEEARKAHERDLNKAGMWGTHGHDLIDIYVSEWIKRGEKPTEPILSFAQPDISNEGKCVGLSAEKFFKDHILFPVASEKKVLSKKHKYAGTLDSLWLIGEEVKERRTVDGCTTCAWEEKTKHRLKCTWCKREIKLEVLLGDWKSSNAIFGHGAMGKYEYSFQCSAYDIALREMTGVRPTKHWIVRLDKHKPYYEVGVISDIKRAGQLFLYMSQISDYARSNKPPITPLVEKTVIRL